MWGMGNHSLCVNTTNTCNCDRNIKIVGKSGKGFPAGISQCHRKGMIVEHRSGRLPKVAEMHRQRKAPVQQYLYLKSKHAPYLPVRRKASRRRSYHTTGANLRNLAASDTARVSEKRCAPEQQTEQRTRCQRNSKAHRASRHSFRQGTNKNMSHLLHTSCRPRMASPSSPSVSKETEHTRGTARKIRKSTGWGLR